MKVLVISAHPDDETLGAGGTLLKHIEAGDEVHWLVATRATPRMFDAATLERKDKEVAAVAAAYPMAGLHRLDFGAGQLEQVTRSQLMDSLAGVIFGLKPKTIYCVYGGDVNSDHQVLFDAVLSVIKPFKTPRLGLRDVYCFETPSSTDGACPHVVRQPFVANTFVDISPFIQRKLEIMALFESEVQSDPLPRGPSALEALARHRGSIVGLAHAEAMMLIRSIR
jgi:LmbE family N-acetylglucosaminyl deacetylase